ncbi:amino acid adenylation domain-containing protein [Actinokineospora bangkokensis]|uniref:Carrier domain-containing protein n=1 Tax=Actinokineospora bangkokensis TaxID=1193682 RepID=A0A1Q9LIT4_9PSEU|nr:non-ribosomal peptide synthetase [Actinokineospora bangkokensis]OLR91936.1 hypothetical protein BJP25_24215 [Actinokineospora bangkokensis]
MTSGVLPLSAGQRDIWFDRLRSGGGRATMGGYLDITGPVDPAALLRAARLLLAEAECTRAVVVDRGGEAAQQVVDAPAPVVVDLRGADDPAAASLAVLRTDLAAAFPDGAPPVRVRLCLLADDRAHLGLFVDHLLCDGYSQVILWRRLAALYTALTTGEDHTTDVLPPLAGLLAAETANLAEAAVERDRAFWVARGAEPFEPVTLSRGRNAPTAEFARHGGVLEHSDALRAAAWRYRVTWPTVVLAAAAAYTARLTGRSDGVLSLPVSARVGRTMLTTPGMVNNFVPLRVPAPAAATVADLVRATVDERKAVTRHQRLRASGIRRALGLRSDDPRPFGPFVNFLPQDGALRLGPCAAEVRSLSTGLVDDFEFTAAEGAGSDLELYAVGNLGLHTDAEVAAHRTRFADFLHRLATAGPGTPLGRIGVATTAEAAPLVGPPGEPHVGITARVAAHAASTPDATAVQSDRGSITYSQLVARAAAVSTRVHGPVAAVLAARGIDCVTAVLGVLGGGAAYLPLDVHSPYTRLAALLEDSGAASIVADPAHEGLARDLAGGRPVVVVGGTAEPPPVRQPAGAPAYVIYTSGSTGRPKGAVVHHGGMVNHLLSKVDELSLGPADVVVHNAPLTFDISVWQMLAALVVGGCVRVVDRHTGADPERLFGLPGATVLEVVPSLLRAALDGWDAGAPTPAAVPRVLLATGEALPGELVDRWLARFPGTPVVNAYGPTECSDDVAHAALAEPIGGGRAPIGTPVRGTRLLVLGDDLRPLPPGVPGELYVGGRGVGLGYRGDTPRTAATFVADPWGGPGERMYRTGDRVVLRADGRLEFLERRDEQVKVRGHRVEPGEVEAVLRGLPEVADAAVAAVPAADGHRVLVGWLVPAPGTAVDTTRVRTRLAAALPEHLVPSVLVALSALPLTAHGKVDRAALPAPDLDRAETDSGQEQATGARTVLASAMAEVLGVRSVDPGENFFTAGGDSIGAINLVNRVRSAGLVITPQDVFEHPTPAALAEVAVDVARPVAAEDGLGALVLPPAVQQLRDDVGGRADLVRDYAQYAVVDLPPEADAAGVRAALRALVDHHDALRMTLSVPVPGLWGLAVPTADGAPVPLVVVDAEPTGAELATRRAEAAAALSPEDGALVRAVLFERAHVLLLVVHHFAVDGVSWRVLLADLRAAWEGRALEPVPTSFRGWTRAITEEAAGDRRLAELPLWRAAEATGPSSLDRELDTGETAGSLRVELSPEVTGALLHGVPAAAHAEPVEVLVAVLATALGDGGPVTIEVEGHGREPVGDADLSRTAGWFTSAFPLRVDPGRGVGEAVHAVKAALRALPDRGAGYGRLRHLNPQAGRVLTGRAPSFGHNHLGRFDTTGGPWSLRADRMGLLANPALPLRHEVEVVTAVVDRPGGPVLLAEFTWAGRLRTDAEAAVLADRWRAAAEELGARAAAGAVRRGPEDFPLVRVTQSEVDALEAVPGGLADLLPLTPLQRALVLHEQDTYTVQMVVDLAGPLDADALSAAARALVARHTALRTTFHQRADADPLQVVHTALEPPFTLLRARDAEELAALTEADRTAPFGDGPLVRFTLVRTGADQARLLWTTHHLVTDGWSNALLAEELFTLAGGGEVTRPAVGPREHLAHLAGYDAAAAAAAWRAEFDGVDGPTVLGAPTRGAELPKSEVVELDQGRTAAFTAAARSRGLTPGSALSVAYALVLGARTGRSDVVFGVVTAGRPADLPGADRAVGAFMHTMPVRVRLAPDMTAARLAAEVVRSRSRLEPHQHGGLAGVQHATGQAQLFNTVLSVHNYPLADFRAVDGLVPGVRVTGGAARVAAEYPLAVEAVPGERLRLSVQYRPDTVTTEAARAVLDALVAVVDWFAEDADRPLRDAPTLAPGERALVLGGGDAPREPDTTVVERFHAAALAAPEAPAVHDATGETSYAVLAERVNRTARMLISHGVGPGDAVAVALPRSLDQVVALLGVLTAGAAYVPVDVEHLSDRVTAVLAEVEPAAVLTRDGRPPADLSAPDGTPVLGLGGAAFSGAPVTDADRTAPLTARHAAYLVHTSGSTGTPKGVVVEHGGVVAMVESLVERFGLTTGPRVLQFASVAFDAHAWELGLALLTGGTLVLTGPEHRLPGDPLADLLVSARVSLLCVPPAVALDLPHRDLPADTVLVVAGEACPDGVLDRWAHRVRLHNGYGPTESVVAATVAGPLTGTGRPSIGRPTRAHRVRLLDAWLRPVPPGAPGELYVAANLARGYLGRPGQTAARFVADPFGPAGSRLYRTGDLARQRPNGELDFLGRVDDQVQVRGFRVEPGEVVAALTRHPGVARAAVVPRGVDGQRRLVAYVVPAGTFDAAELRAHMVTALPEHMVPGAFVEVADLPLTPRGKLDVAALPDPVAVVDDRGRAPRDEVERILLDLYRDVLDRPGLGVESDFFAEGGHSLLVTRVIARARAALGVDLPIRAVFELRTVEALAAWMAEDARAERPELVRADVPDDAEHPLSSAQRRSWFQARLQDGDRATYTVPVAVRLSGRVDEPALDAAVRDVALRHPVLRTAFPEVDGEPSQRVLASTGHAGVVTVDLDPALLRQTLLAEAATGFATTEPGLRSRLYRLGQDDAVLLLLFHHIGFDGGSLEPLMRDLGTAYRARVAGTAPRWRPLPVRYSDYARWQRELLGTDDRPTTTAADQVAHWRAALAGLPEELPLPTDFPRPATGSDAGGEIEFTVDCGLLAGVRRLAAETATTPFMVLQAAVAALLTRLGAGTDIPLGTPVAGRSEAALDDLIGFFVNTVVLRVDTAGDPTFRELLARVRAVDLAAYANQDVPFEQVVDELRPERSLSRHPLFQVLVALQQGAPAVALPGLVARVERVPTAAAKFDLTVEFAEHGDGLGGLLTFRRDLFTERTAAAITDRIVRVLRAVTAAPDTRVSAVDLLGAEEREQVLVRWNATRREVPPIGLPRLLAEQAARTPDRPAVVDGERVLDFRELDEASARLAVELVARGAGPERVIALALPRAATAVVSVLAVLRTGAAYLPVEPTHPVARLRGMVERAGAGILLTTAEFAAALRGCAADIADVVVLDDPATAAAISAHDPAAGAPVEPDQDSAAYVIFTSGSTGQPKGVVVPHRAVRNYLAWVLAELPASGRGALVISPLSFDLTVTGLYAPLLAGGPVHLVDPTGPVPADPVAARDGVAFLKATPSHLALLDALPAPLVPTAELCLGGEPLPGRELRGWRDRHPGGRVVNEYGPTETTVGCTVFAVEPGERVPDGVLPLGRPIWNTRTYVLDERLAPAPVGVVGELYVAGEGLARGYAGRPDLTAERFVADPFGPPGSRMYRTGDLARWDASGDLVFGGRRDHQVKLRGFRVETGEVEAVLAAHPDVVRAAVVVRDDRTGDPALVAYVVPRGGVAVQALVDHARSLLPDYLVPSSFTLLDELPLTGNGKLDRGALPAPEAVPTAPPGGRAPRTREEEVLVGIVREVLAVPAVGVTDNVFDAGLDSIRTIKVVARARKAGVALEVADVFAHQSVAEMAAVLAERARVERAAAAPVAPAARVARVFDRLGDLDPFATVLRLRAGGDLPPVFCLPSGVGFSLPYVGLAEHLDPAHPIYGIQAPSVTELAPRPGTVEALADEYVELIRRVRSRGPYHLVGWSFGGVLAHRAAVRLRELGEQVGLLANLDAYPGVADKAAAGGSGQGVPEQELLAWLARTTGGARLAPGATPADVLAELKRAGSPMAALGERRLAAVVEQMHANQRLLAGYLPQRYDGEMLLVTATAGLSEAEVQARTARWVPHTAGLDVHRVPCAHDDMMEPAPLAVAGAAIAARLAAWHGTAR